MKKVKTETSIILQRSLTCLKPGVSSLDMLKGQGRFHFAKGTNLNVNKKLLKGTKAKTKGNRGLCGLQGIPGLLLESLIGLIF